MPSKDQLADWGYGDPDAAEYATNIGSYTAGGITLSCHRELIPIFQHLTEQLAEWGVNLAAGQADDWGYSNRDIRGVFGVKSWHSVGAAIDLDATRNPVGSRTTTFPIRKTEALVADIGLTWGRVWRDRPDPMHFEVAHPLPVMRQIAARLRPTQPDRPAFRRPLSHGDYGPAVLWVQRRLADLGYLTLTPDGRFGWHTSRAVRRWESDNGYRINGVVTAQEYDALAK